MRAGRLRGCEMLKKIPVYLTYAQAARLMGMDWHNVRNWARRVGVHVDRDGRREWMSVELVKRKFPDLYREILTEAYEKETNAE